ncbi:MAG: T9SS type A sorting domain-containing protein [Sphingobacteriaceae bacterium]|nr:T9SS type A sorting domain-containing protein [Sphingobacteriaceae bacterium]
MNDFIKLGGTQGDCICFAERNYEYDGYDLFTAKVGPDQIDIVNQYLSTLALEYKLLSRANQSTNGTLREIYYILETYNRLDEEADQFWSQSPPGSDIISRFPLQRNGFLLREDMPLNYFDSLTSSQNFLHFNYAYKEYNNSKPKDSISFTGLHSINKLSDDNKFCNFSGFIGAPGDQPIEDLSINHDKYYSMFNAFLLLIKYLPNNSIYYENGQAKQFSDGVIDIKTEIRNIATRCYNYFTGGQFGNNNLDWLLEYPDGVTLTAGAHMWPYSYPMAKMYCYIQNEYPWPWPCNSNQNAMSLTTGFTAYNGLYINIIPPTTPIIGSEDASVFLGNVQAGSNAPVFIPGPLPGGYLPVPIPISTAMLAHTTVNNVQWARLLRKVLHQNQPIQSSESLFSSPISQAPCKGPYNFGNCNHGGYEWSSQDKLEHPKARGKDCETQGGAFIGNYPGVDYMLLHNLYYEYLNQKDDKPGVVESGAYKNAYNLMDNYDEQTWPLQYIPLNGPFGQNAGVAYLIGVNQEVITYTNFPGPGGPVTYIIAPARVKLFQNLESRAQIYAASSPAAPNNTDSSKVEYRAGKEITLLPESGNKPGFEVKLGSDFSAYIKRYICSGNNDPLALKQSSKNEDYRSNDFETDLMNTEIPIHYVEHPKSNSDLFPESSEVDQYSSNEINEIQNILLNEYQIKNPEQINNIQNELLAQRFVALPNPCNGVFKLYAAKLADDEIFSYSIKDMKGQEIMHEENIKTNIQKEINLNNYADGIYLIQLQTNKGYQFHKKITVIK